MVRDMRNTRPEKQSLTPMQKQAVLVCSVCALAAILTIAITMTLLKRGKTPATPGEQPSSEVLVPGEEDISDHYQISETSAALLPETADAGESYQKETLFLGDSNTVRLYANGLISLQQFCAKEGIGTHAALNEGIVTFKKDSSTYTIAQAVAKMKPRRVVIMLGTNDTGMSVDEFIKNYTALVQAIQESYPYTDIIVNTVPPIPENHSNYPHMDQAKIDDFNMALLNMCEQLGVRFLNTAEVLKGENGYGQLDYYTDGVVGGVILKGDDPFVQGHLGANALLGTELLQGDQAVVIQTHGVGVSQKQGAVQIFRARIRCFSQQSAGGVIDLVVIGKICAFAVPGSVRRHRVCGCAGRFRLSPFEQGQGDAYGQQSRQCADHTDQNGLPLQRCHRLFVRLILMIHVIFTTYPIVQPFARQARSLSVSSSQLSASSTGPKGSSSSLLP